MEPKHPDSIFKTHLEERKLESQLDSAKENLAKTYVNAFVNARLCNDLLISSKGEGADDWSSVIEVILRRYSAVSEAFLQTAI